MIKPAGSLLGSGPFSRARTTVVCVSTAALVTLGLGTAPATSAPDAACPQAFPVAEVAKGQAVHGLTVTEGTEPGPFTGEVLGVIDDGIAPDLDMVIARLTSPEIDRVGGIWQGMSGSPVYAADGRLIGAVAYGLSFGSSPVAGITPAADMQKLLSSTPAISGAAKVAMPPSLARQAAGGADTTAREAGSGMSRLRLPVGISGLVSGKRLQQATKALGMKGAHTYQAGGVSTAAEPIDIVAGGNLAASVSYGDLSVIGVGTATAVCGDEVLAFGHPMNFSGPSTMSMHGASAVFIQEDKLGAPFKVANPGAPVGGIVQDRLAGLLGVDGDVPETADVTSFVTVPDESSRTGATHISVPAAVPDLAPFHMLVDQDRIFDGVSGGHSEVSWTVQGTRANGAGFSYTRHDRFANDFDISFEPVFDLADQLFRLQNNGVEKITLDKISTRSVMHRDLASYQLKTVQMRTGGQWVKLVRNHTLRLRAGVVKRFRVGLSSAELGPKQLVVQVHVPKRARGRVGMLDFVGGNSFFDENSLGGGPALPFDQLLKQLAGAPRNDQVLANLDFFVRRSTIDRSVRRQAGAVVDGEFAVQVRVARRR